VAITAHDGYARAIAPAHSSNDGDAIFVMATGEHNTHPDIIGVYGAVVMEKAIHNAITATQTH
jgi:L-aminopeptidase/D-esterase-like protein